MHGEHALALAPDRRGGAEHSAVGQSDRGFGGLSLYWRIVTQVVVEYHPLAPGVGDEVAIVRPGWVVLTTQPPQALPDTPCALILTASLICSYY